MGKTAKPADYFFKEAEACRLLFLGGQKTTKIKARVPPSKPGIAAKMKTLKAQFKVMFKDYWYVLVPVHVATSIVW